jgi:hypothetical protein
MEGRPTSDGLRPTAYSPQPTALWSYEDLAARWRVSARSAKAMAKRIGLRPVVLGAHCMRFRPAAVMKAEEGAEQGGDDFELKGWRGRRR